MCFSVLGTSYLTCTIHEYTIIGGIRVFLNAFLFCFGGTLSERRATYENLLTLWKGNGRPTSPSSIPWRVQGRGDRSTFFRTGGPIRRGERVTGSSVGDTNAASRGGTVDEEAVGAIQNCV